ncbi:MAG TPA: carboxypeptidase-like regulatory domain-containing protein [Candidatus Angelobacter sp.]|nr:carboxypeptidase-like regulatory domain-containing protein [Candidatus Angelobacter sp.]
MARKIGFVLAVLLAGLPAWGAATGGISGYVKNAAGEPQMGAMVEVFTSILRPGATVFTDSHGFYSAENLPAGTYQIKVTSALFLPALREDVSLRAGAHVLVNLTLNTLADALRLLPPRRNNSTEADDWHWTLRSTANRPILRVLDGPPAAVSSAEKEDDRTVKGRVAFIAGAEGEGFGSPGEVTTAFALEKSLFSTGTLSFNGDIASSSGLPAGVLHAAYTHQVGNSTPSVTITWRHFASPGTTVQNSPYDAIAITTSDNMSVAGLVDLDYGADLESLDFTRRVIALRPFGSARVHLSPDMVVEYRYATSEPDTRAAKGYDSAPADLSEAAPRMSLAGGEPRVEDARHQEVSISRRMGNTNVQFAYYADVLRNAVLTGAGDPSGYSSDVLPDVYSGTFSYSYSGLSTTGGRVVLQQKISDDLTATADYSTGGVISARGSSAAWQDLPQFLTTDRQHSLGAKFDGCIPATKTRLVASYRWTSGNALSQVDAFNASPGQMDPYFSVFIRQPIPGLSLVPGKIEALIDLRNLLAQGYLPILGQDGHTVYLVQSARTLRGGLAFTF